MKYSSIVLALASLAAAGFIDSTDSSNVRDAGGYGVPAPEGCYWDGTAPLCEGNCHDNWQCGQSDWAGGINKFSPCVTGTRKLCCRKDAFPHSSSCPWVWSDDA